MPLTTIHLNLANCYGISSLQTAFDFSNAKVYAVYAPNGSMKTSLAQTFRDVADGKLSKDLIFPDRVTTRDIVDDTGTELPKDSIVVVSPYDKGLGLTEKTSVLLVNATLREEYETLLHTMETSKQHFLQLLQQQSQSKKNLEEEISSTFTPKDDQFYVALKRVQNEVAAQPDRPFSQIRYDLIFDNKILLFLNTKDFKVAITDYVKKYNELLDASTFFSRLTFNWYNATTIGKSLAKNGFFDAKHTINLHADRRYEVASQQDLEALISGEKDRISSNTTLRRKYSDIEKLLTKNQLLRDFQNHLAENEALLPKLENLDSLKEEIWLFHFKNNIDVYERLIAEYDKISARKKEIENEAVSQRTQWESVITEFNRRFVVPFKLIVENRARVILGTDSLPRLGFIFQESAGTEEAPVTKDTLMKTLSTGEKKALYVLNIIFEVEARRKENQETLFVFDDIADSFDYRNKYAIIQYLMDIADEPRFKQLLLTHNFDFFRTVNSRFVRYKHCLMAAKTQDGLLIRQAEGIKNPFINDWKRHFFTDPRKRIASIPFLRNLIEYTKGTEDPDYLTLTSLLHWKSDSASITQSRLDSIYHRMFESDGKSPNGRVPVVDIIDKAAGTCMTTGEYGDSINFENKIVLSIAIRLAADRFMVERIDDLAAVAKITTNQTQRLLKTYQQYCGDDDASTLTTLKDVVLMTPDNIHLNAFMYEPIVDMSDEHLKKLYSDVQGLRVGVTSAESA